MNKLNFILVITPLVFVFGLAAGNLIAFPQIDKATSQSVLKTVPGSPGDDEDTERASQPTDLNSDMDLDSFVEFASLQQVDDSAFAADIEQVTKTDRVDTAATRDVITAQFPDLDEETLAGWVDTYSGMPLRKLSALLQQRQMMPSLIPDLPSFADQSSEVLESITPATRLQDSIRCCQLNLSHAYTVGYRRRQQFAFVSGRGAEADSVTHLEQFDFQPGEIRKSSNKLHVAIDGQPEVMFLLGPGNVMTRCGMFSRQLDGGLGVSLGDASLRVEGTTLLPLDATDISVSVDGTVTYRDLEHDQRTAGQIKLVTVSNLSALTSENGVYFTVAEASDSAYTINEETELVTEALEVSNVIADKEWALLEHFEKLGQLP